MKDFNYYMRMTRSYLEDYRSMKAQIDVWDSERKNLLIELSSIPVAISKYGGEPGGGTGELNAVERLANDRIEKESRVKEIERDTKTLRSLMSKVENALSVLDGEAEKIVREHYIDGIAWYGIADQLHLTESCIRQRGHRAIRSIAKTVFGLKAHPDYQVVLIS